jgi:hypothetical protein
MAASYEETRRFTPGFSNKTLFLKWHIEQPLAILAQNAR